MKTQITLLDQVFNISAVPKDKVNNWGGDCYTVKVNNIQFTYTNSVAAIGHKLSEDDLLFAFRCFISDAQAVEYSDFEEFCYQFGYDFENSESKQIYNACKRSLKSAQRLTDLDLCDLLNEMSEQGIITSRKALKLKI